MIVRLKAVLEKINASLRIIPTKAPNTDFGNDDCIQIESFHVTCLTAFDIL